MVFDQEPNHKKLEQKSSEPVRKNEEKSGSLQHLDSIEEKAKENGNEIKDEIGKAIERSIERRLSKKGSIANIDGDPRNGDIARKSSKSRKESINLDEI